MDKLPNEVLITIFKHLHLQQKLECMSVCRKYALILSSGYLFETIYLVGGTYDQNISRKRRDALVETANSKPHYGRKCKRFVLDKASFDILNIAKLAKTFPSLSLLHLNQSPVCILPAGPTQVDPFEGWKKNLETLCVGNNKSNALSTMLKGGVYNRLSVIKTKLNDIYPYPPAPFELFSSFRNTPALTSLTLDSYLVTIGALETLHNNAQELTSLVIKNGCTWGPADLQLHDIKPAEKMKILTIVNVSRKAGRWDSLVEYIRLKYTHLSQFTYSEKITSAVVGRGDEDLEPEWTDLISTIGPRLELCRVKLPRKNSEIYNLLVGNATQLKELFVCVDLPPLKLYRILPELPMTTVISLSLQFVHWNFLMSDLQALTRLIILRISSKFQMNISLNSIVRNLPRSTKLLYLQKANLTIDESKLYNHSNITRLELYRSTMIDTKTSAFLTRYLQKLKSISLNDCTLGNLIDLPYHHLDFIRFSPHMCPLDGYIDFQLTMSDKTYHYDLASRFLQREDREILGSEHGRSLQDVLRPEKRINNLDQFHFRCASLKTGYFHHYHLLF